MLLCVDGDAGAREGTAAELRAADFEVATAASAGAARDRLGDDIGCLVTEQTLLDGTGLELIREVRKTTPDTSCVLYIDVPIDEIDTAAFGDVVAEYLRREGPDAESGLVEQGVAFRS